MPPKILPLSRSVQFYFDNGECLYRGFNGERVLVDVEGEGTLLKPRSDLPLTVVRDGQPTKEFPTVFRYSLTVSSEHQGELMAEVTTGVPRLDPTTPHITVSDSYEGAGWIVGGEGKCQVDARHEWLDLARIGGPVPVRSSVQGVGRFILIPLPETRCQLVDAWDIEDTLALKERDWTVQNMSKLRGLDSYFSDGVSRFGQVASHLNAGRWSSRIPAEHEGIILRRYYDRFHGRQRARVHVNGNLVGVWYEPREDRVNRWAISDFGIPLAATKGRSFLEITIDPPSGVSLWSVSRMEVWALTHS